MKIVLAIFSLLLSSPLVAAHLTVINESGVPFQLKINKNKHLIDINQRENRFEFKRLVSLRFFGKCTDLPTHRESRKDFVNGSETRVADFIDTHDFDLKIVFFQLTAQNQARLMEKFGIDSKHYFAIMDRLLKLPKDMKPEEVSGELKESTAQLQVYMTTFAEKIKPGFEALFPPQEPTEDATQVSLGEIDPYVDHDEISHMKRKTSLKTFCEALAISPSLICEEELDVKVTLSLSDRRTITYEVENVQDGLLHGQFSRKGAFHSGKSNRITRKITLGSQF
jgi:hypothetical protein